MLKSLGLLVRIIVLTAVILFGVSLPAPVRAATNIKICIVDYHYHNDSQPNADMTAIKAAQPDILIDNTAYGLWGIDGGNGGNDYTNPAEYIPLGIHVYSYITAGDEGTAYDSSIDGLSGNLARIDGIAGDGATGVFLDQVKPDHLSTSDKSYLSAVYNECRSQGLKLIINVGESTFDYTYLSTVCDYIMTDEAFAGRLPTSSEIGMGLNRCIVVNNACSSAAEALKYTAAARSNGFGWSWNTDSSQYDLPYYLNDYIYGLNNYDLPVYTYPAPTAPTNVPAQTTFTPPATPSLPSTPPQVTPLSTIIETAVTSAPFTPPSTVTALSGESSPATTGTASKSVDLWVWTFFGAIIAAGMILVNMKKKR
jgi:hypothetical protein